MSARAIILSAGLGTRLRPLTLELPKPLVPVGDRPLIALIAGRLRAAGVTDIAVNVHHLAEKITSDLEATEAAFRVIHEPRILGTAGGISGARRLFGGGTLLVWNGDILAEPPLDGLLAAAGGGSLVLALAARPGGAGSVGVGADSRIVRLRGERFGDEAWSADYIGVAAVGAGALAAMPDEGCLIGDYAIPELRRGGSVHAVPLRGAFRDVGSVESYWAANQEWLDERGLDSWIHPRAQVSPGVRVSRSIVGADAVVDGQGVLEGVVVWSGARATAPLARSVVARSALVPVGGEP